MSILRFTVSERVVLLDVMTKHWSLNALRERCDNGTIDNLLAKKIIVQNGTVSCPQLEKHRDRSAAEIYSRIVVA